MSELPGIPVYPYRDFVILGTDTDAGKTTFALLLLAAFPGVLEYWKPVETGDSDTERVRRLLPGAVVHPPVARFQAPVAPPLAARQEGRAVPLAHAIATARPRPSQPHRQLLIETFGSPFSPLNETELLLALIERLKTTPILVSASHVGAIGRTLQCLRALHSQGLEILRLVLVGPRDPYAEEQIRKYYGWVWTTSVEPPKSWDAAGVAQAAAEARAALEPLSEEFLLTGSDLPWSGPQIPADVPEDVSTLLKRDALSVWHPYTSLREQDPPLVCVGAQDEFLHLADGSKVIDGISSWWTILHGHRHPPLMSVLTEAMKSYDHVHFAGVTHPPAIGLAESLLRSARLEGGRVFYSDNGSTAVEVALKMAYQYWCLRNEPRRMCFIGFEHGYHGDTFGAMAVSRDPVFFGRFEPLLLRAEIVPLSAVRLDEALKRLQGEVAAVIIEPLVQGAGGMRMHTPQELHDIAEVARKRNVLLIVDEVMTAGGRTGSLWAHHAAGITPDLICVAKTLAGGILPLAATLATPHVVGMWDTDDRSRTFFHGHSFTAHPLACSVALANWQTLSAAVQPAPAHMEAFWNQALDSLRGHPRVRDVRIRGTIAAAELDVPGGYLADVGRQLRRECLRRGVLLRPLGNVLYTLPPFCTSDESLQQIAEVMTGAVKSLD